MESCEVIRDLMPLYADGLASGAAGKLIEDHLEHCEACWTVWEQMQVPMPSYDPVKNADFKKVLRKQRAKNKKRSVIAAVTASVLTVLAALAVCWYLDVFYYLGTYVSPDGQTKTTVYSRDITEFVPQKDRFTLVDEGKFAGRTVLWGEFDGLWWSADSNYQVVSLMDEGECYLTLFDYVRNCGSNLDNYLERGIYGMEEFENVSKDSENQKIMEFRFLQWSQYDSNMLVYFSYVDVDGVDRDGYFWYNYTSGEVTGVVFLETAVVEGVITAIGADFYSMALDNLDENGNVRGFVFGIFLACISPVFPLIYQVEPSVRALATSLILVLACHKPLMAFIYFAYFSMRSGGKTWITFFFDCGVLWLLTIPVSILLTRFTGWPILAVYACCQGLDIIKCFIGYFLMKKGTWIQKLSK